MIEDFEAIKESLRESIPREEDNCCCLNRLVRAGSWNQEVTLKNTLRGIRS